LKSGTSLHSFLIFSCHNERKIDYWGAAVFHTKNKSFSDFSDFQKELMLTIVLSVPLVASVQAGSKMSMLKTMRTTKTAQELSDFRCIFPFGAVLSSSASERCPSQRLA
jgi:hypothetical protein